ncbi:MAG: TetR/AcrR family transcriptional regulator [Raineya sp.]|jgi:TetR/AcrR family transcriptional repressor of nem operon|nr:TetR/AcrR family transcriptional regulator [Raineya sp.]
MPRNKEFNQDEVLDKAIQLFWEKGYNACSMQDVVDGLGLSRSSIYDTFTDKKNLFLQSLKKYQEDYTSIVINMLNNSSDIRKTLEDIFDNIVQDVEKCLLKGCFMTNSTIELAHTDEEISQIINGNKQQIELALEKALQKGQDSGQISQKNNPKVLSKYLYSNLAGLRVIAKNKPHPDEIREVINVIMQAL